MKYTNKYTYNMQNVTNYLYIYALLHVSANIGHLQGEDYDTKEFISTHVINSDMLKNF